MDEPHPTDEVRWYLVFRAELEGTENTLSRGLYVSHWHRGVRRFFGVRVSDDGALLIDEQNPDALARWRLPIYPSEGEPT